MQIIMVHSSIAAAISGVNQKVLPKITNGKDNQLVAAIALMWSNRNSVSTAQSESICNGIYYAMATAEFLCYGNAIGLCCGNGVTLHGNGCLL